ncbi:MAG: carbon-nitrogen hydrolase family protein, partial [Xanthomonadales bacterium]|nr:carbon-nitrogen hydrolase family protein [Xanthomonadales bacterium]
FNTAPVIDPAGEVVARYRKRYPFLPYERGVTAGDEFVVFDVPGAGRIGLLICYDMWYPEMARQLAWMGAEAIIVPTLTNTNDRELELALARTNAAINQAYVVNINSAGRMAYGRSIVVGPDGTVIHQAASGREIITAELDFGHVRRVRERGMHGLAQPLKSFRDARVEFPVYQAGAGPGALATLGELALPGPNDADE